MVSLDEVLAAMPDEAEDVHEFLTIDAAARRILVPEAEAIFGVENDREAERKYFRGPRYVGDDLDLADMFLTVYFRNANGDEDGYLVDDVAVDGDDITFSWLLSEKVTAFPGEIQFAVCAARSKDGTDPDWNTTLASGTVLEGLHADPGDVEEQTSDVVTQLREEIKNSTAAVEATGAAQIGAVEAAGANAAQAAKDAVKAQGAATLATIPEDYTALAGKVNEQANAIKGHLSGEIVRADDVSPVEHFLDVKVRSENPDTGLPGVTVTRCGKNLVSNMGATFEGTGIEWTVNDDGTVVANGTAVTECVCTFSVLGAKSALIGKMVTLSGCPAGGSRSTYTVMQRNYGKFDTGAGVSFQIANSNFTAWGVLIYEGATVNNLVFSPQLELGEAVTDYEKPAAQQVAMPAEDGTVGGLTSMAPTMTLLTGTAGVTIECTYNRDSNAVLAEILEKIAAVSG